MNLRFCVLASGSRGNCTLVAAGQTCILVDAGLSGREVERRLEEVRIDPAGIDAICVSHEHDDHKAGLGVLQRRYAMALYANSATIEALERSDKYRGLQWRVFTTGASFAIGDITLEPFSVPHDSYDPVGFVVQAGDARLGIVTDMGAPTELIRQRLGGCRAIILEANHDEGMLRDAARPWALKQRIAGRQGHLSNAQAAELLLEIAHPDLRHVLLAHLSSDCNRPELAARTVGDALCAAGHTHIDVALTHPDRPTSMITL